MGALPGICTLSKSSKIEKQSFNLAPQLQKPPSRINKVLLYSTGNYIQYPVIFQNGKEYEKEYIYICITESLCCTAEIDTTS